LGFEPGPIDDIYGPKMREAVDEFEQSEKGLRAHADGYFGSLTWRLLFKVRD
jgi:peptidoglycan hydrolase-like protein with peptidoglycan-binding domain